MKMRRRKKLNRKGFTLIELLAVIVILAVIMVIASTSVISSMNSSKRKSLQNSAASAADAFTTAFSEAILNNETTFYNISGLMEGTDTKNAVASLKKTGDGAYTVNVDALGINETDYDLANSYVMYDGSKVTVCFSVTSSSQFYVAADKSGRDVSKGTGNTFKLAKDTMWACSNGDTSWTTGKAQQ